MGQTPESFTGRILFMSMFNDIFCDRYDNKDECLRNANIVKTFAGRFGIGQWSFIGPTSEKSGIFPRIVHKELGTILRKTCCWNSKKADIPFPCNDSIVQGSVEKQRTRKVVYTLRCRSRHN